MSTIKAKKALVYVGASEVMRDLLDELKDTPFYKQKTKNLCNSLQKELLLQLEKTYKVIGEDLQKDHFKIVSAVEVFMDCVKGDNLEEFTAFCMEYKDGNIRYE